MTTNLKESIRTIPDFPKPGIQFKDITGLLNSPELFREMIDTFAARYKTQNIQAILGIEARGFIIGAALAYKMQIGFIPVRKKGKLPAKTITASYKKEYGIDELEIHEDALEKGRRVIIIDDLIATGGTLQATIDLAQQAGANIIEAACLIELVELAGRNNLNTPLFSLCKL